MNRRAFLSTLGAALAGATLDPERLLWRPGAKTIFLPSLKVLRDPAIGISMRFIQHYDIQTDKAPQIFDCFYWPLPEYRAS